MHHTGISPFTAFSDVKWNVRFNHWGIFGRKCLNKLISLWPKTSSCQRATTEPRHDKTNKVICAPSKDSDQLGHPPRQISMKKPWVFSYSLCAERRLWSDWLDAQADLSLRWTHRSLCWFVMLQLNLCWVFSILLLLKWLLIIMAITFFTERRDQSLDLLSLTIFHHFIKITHIYKLHDPTFKFKTC